MESSSSFLIYGTRLELERLEDTDDYKFPNGELASKLMKEGKLCKPIDENLEMLCFWPISAVNWRGSQILEQYLGICISYVNENDSSKRLNTKRLGALQDKYEKEVLKMINSLGFNKKEEDIVVYHLLEP